MLEAPDPGACIYQPMGEDSARRNHFGCKAKLPYERQEVSLGAFAEGHEGVKVGKQLVSGKLHTKEGDGRGLSW